MSGSKKNFKIGIDARMYAIPGGIGRYTKELIKGLEKLDTSNLEFVIFSDKKGYEEYKPKKENFKKVLADVKWYGLREQIQMPKIWKKGKCDLIHFTHFNKSIFYRRPYVVTIHDLTYTQQKKLKITKLPPILYYIKYWFYEGLIKDTILKAKKIIVPTNYSKKDIVGVYGINPNKVTVTYESVGKEFSPEKKKDVFERVSKRFKVTEPYFLYVGNASPHKNLKKLIEGFVKLIENENHVQLVLAGKKDRFYAELEEWVKNMIGSGDPTLTAKIIFTGVVSDEELQTLLSNSYAFVFPSLAEGFGIPPLEAMASGTPVLLSNASCLPEVCGNAAFCFDPNDENDIRDKMKEILENENKRESLIKKGLEHIKKFSWEKMAKETLEVYKEVLEDL